jgi:hypothetical protein
MVLNIDMSETYQVFTHNDLDGALSLLSFMWSKPDATISYQSVSNLEISKIKQFITNTINCKNVYVFDLALRDEFLPELDSSCVTIVDHHERSIPYLNKFKYSKILHKKYSSNCLLNKKLFIDSKNIELSNEQKKLIALADDYDSNKLELKESIDLNIIFWTFYKNNFSNFIKDYYNGFKSPKDEHQKIINLEKTKALKTANEVPKYSGILNIKGKEKKVLGIQSETLNVLSKNFILKNLDYDLYFFINPKLNKVTVNQKNEENQIDLNAFAQKFCDGNGDNKTAVGKITPLFMELTKNLKNI